MGGATWFDPSNAEQVRAWDGDEGTFWADHADQFDLAMHGYQQSLLRAAKIGRVKRLMAVRRPQLRKRSAFPTARRRFLARSRPQKANGEF